MRATIPSTQIGNKRIINYKNSHLTSKSQQKKKKNSLKSHKSKQKKNIQINDSHRRTGQIENQCRLEYFNKEKNIYQKKTTFQNNGQYSCDLQKKNRFNQQKKSKQSKQELNAVNRFKLPHGTGVITFDGKVQKIQPIRIENKKSRSVQYDTDIISRNSLSKSKYNKKSKSFHKKEKSKKRKNQSKSTEQHCILKQLIKSQKKEYTEHIEAKQIKQKLQKEYKPQRIQNLDLNMIKNQMQKQIPLVVHLLKKFNTNKRIQSIEFARLSKDVFFQTIFLIDRYINEQLIISKLKILTISCLMLVIKLDNSFMSKCLSKEMFNIVNQINDNFQIQPTIKKQSKPKRQAQKRIKQFQKIKTINQRLKSILQQQFDVLPSIQQIIEFQNLVLMRENFSVRKIGLSFWIDSLSQCWDRFLINKISASQFSLKMTFRYMGVSKNYFYLVQIIQACLYDIKVYNFKFYELVLATMFLICRANTENLQKQFDEYNKNLQKSCNILFIDKFGINALFAEFLQLFTIQIGDILPCCKFASTFLNPNILDRVNVSKWYNSKQQQQQNVFYKHYNNKKIIQFFQKKQQNSGIKQY